MPTKPNFSIYDKVVVRNREAPAETFDGSLWFVLRRDFNGNEEWEYTLYSRTPQEFATKTEEELAGFYGELWMCHYPKSLAVQISATAAARGGSPV